MYKKMKLLLCISIMVLAPAVVRAELPWQFDQHTTYMAMGDSLAAGWGAIPTTQGYTYLLYQGGVVDTVPNTIFCNAAVPGATSADVLTYQVPQALAHLNDFKPDVITLTVGGNDLLSILKTGADPNVVLQNFAGNLTKILMKLKTGLPGARIYVSNQYAIPEIAAAFPGLDQVIAAFNQIVDGVAGAVGVPVVDVFTAFGGFEGRGGLLLIDRQGADQFQPHPTNAGYRVMEQAFEAVMK
jgi:lysophospholipase L1-like esterase